MSALDNAIEILRCFAPHQPEISNADVIRLTGKPKSSTSRLLRQLKECGLLEQDALPRRYRPGLLVFELGRLHRTQNDFVALAEQRLRAVCAKTGHTGYISVLDGAEQVVLRVVPGSNPRLRYARADKEWHRVRHRADPCCRRDSPAAGRKSPRSRATR